MSNSEISFWHKHMRTMFAIVMIAVLLAIAYSAKAVTVGANCTVGWDYPVAPNPAIDGFRLYVDGKATATVLSTARRMPCGTLTAGTHKLALTAYNANGESPKSNELEVTSVVGLPVVPTNVTIVVTIVNQ